MHVLSKINITVCACVRAFYVMIVSVALKILSCYLIDISTTHDVIVCCCVVLHVVCIFLIFSAI